MIWNDHSSLDGSHAIFSPSQPAWLRYDDEKILNTFLNRHRTILGTELHEYAEIQIKLGQKVGAIKNLIHDIISFIYTKYKTKGDQYESYSLKLIEAIHVLPKEVFESIKQHINDAIGYRMNSEVILMYSERFFGTADAIMFKDNMLRIHDLKTGSGPVHPEQLMIYAALFCLEYKAKPGSINMELRIYQNGDRLDIIPEADDILPIMDKIIRTDNVLSQL